MGAPFVKQETSQYDPRNPHPFKPDCGCSACYTAYLERVQARNPHHHGYEDQPPRMAWRGIITALGILGILATLVAWVLVAGRWIGAW